MESGTKMKMIRIIALDDEQPALRRVGKLLQAMEGVQISGLFDSPKRLLEHVAVSREPLDLALLDIEMPGINGLELAGKLREMRPELHIAFLTAYEEYAREAFGVEALDYLLKPITSEDLARTLQRFEKRSNRQQNKQRPCFFIRCFGPFSVAGDNGQLIRFRNSKSRELLALLHHAQDKPVSKGQILDSLWPGRDVERAQVNLHSTVYQLRKDLQAYGLQGAVVQLKTAGGSYCLRWPDAMGEDVAEFEEACRLYEKEGLLEHLVCAIQLYGDGYLSGSGYGWAMPRQVELELGYVILLKEMAAIYVRQQRYEMALDPLRKLVHLLPLDERLHAQMAALLLLANRKEEALAYCKAMEGLLDHEGEVPLLDFSRLSANPRAMFQ